MNTLHKDKDQVHVTSKLLPLGKAHDTECPLLIIDGSVHQEVEQHCDAPLDFVLIDHLGHLAGPINFLPKLISKMRPLFTGLDPP
jgi:hypothetical protein